jgi:hypothetical protein
MILARGRSQGRLIRASPAHLINGGEQSPMATAMSALLFISSSASAKHACIVATNASQ